MIPISIGDIDFNTGVADGDGRTWWITEMVGWEMPELRQTYAPITSMDGVVLAESMLNQRTIGLEGVCKVPSGSEAAYWAAYNYFLGKVNFRYAQVLMVVTEDVIDKQLGVVLSSPPQIRHVGMGSFAFQFSVTAQYPIKVASTEDSAAYNGSIAVTNAGNYQTWPVIIMDTPGIPVFTNTTVGTAGNAIGFTDTLPAGTVIDFRARTILSGSGLVDEYPKLDVAQDDWWPLTPGVNNLTRGGTGTATIYKRNAWI